jgi:hypothetical protein
LMNIGSVEMRPNSTPYAEASDQRIALLGSSVARSGERGRY